MPDRSVGHTVRHRKVNDWQVIENTNTERVQDRQTDNPFCPDLSPATGIRARCWCIVFQERRKQNRTIHQVAVLTTRHTHDQPATRGMTDHDYLLGWRRLGHDQVGQIILKLTDIIHITAPPWFCTMPAQIGDQNATGLGQRGAKPIKLKPVPPRSMHQNEQGVGIRRPQRPHLKRIAVAHVHAARCWQGR